MARRLERGFIFGGLLTYLIAGIAVAAILGYTYFKGRQDGREAILRENIAAAVKIVREQGKVTERVVIKYVKVAGETKTKIEVREKEVIRYENAKLDQCPLSNAFVSLHDAAAANTVPDPARSVDGTASGIETAKAIPTVQANYSVCHQTSDRLRGLQEWVREQQKVSQ